MLIVIFLTKVEEGKNCGFNFNYIELSSFLSFETKKYYIVTCLAPDKK